MTCIAICDMPNLDMTLADILGRKPTRADRPDWPSLYRWLETRSHTGRVEACAFTNVNQESCGSQAHWLHYLRAQGFWVFAKPKQGDSDIDTPMLEHIERRRSGGGLAQVVVVSHDSRNFFEPLQNLVALPDGPDVTVVAFREFAGALATSPELEFVDLESIPGLFSKPLPRTDLGGLPEEGSWLAPLQAA
jgi:uncharacterized protein